LTLRTPMPPLGREAPLFGARSTTHVAWSFLRPMALNFVLCAIYVWSTIADQLARRLFGKCCHASPWAENLCHGKRNARRPRPSTAVCTARAASRLGFLQDARLRCHDRCKSKPSEGIRAARPSPQADLPTWPLAGKILEDFFGVCEELAHLARRKRDRTNGRPVAPATRREQRNPLMIDDCRLMIDDLQSPIVAPAVRTLSTIATKDAPARPG
jgi:hypothetical protein